MKSEKEILNELYELPEHFNRHMKNREYTRAKDVYDKAVLLSVFLKVPDEVKIELFGNRPYAEEWEEPVDGKFREDDVLKAYEESIKETESRLKLEKLLKEKYKDRVIYRNLIKK